MLHGAGDSDRDLPLLPVSSRQTSLRHASDSNVVRIFNSFEAAYTSCAKSNETGEINYNKCDPETFGYSETGIPFNDAYRCGLSLYIRPSEQPLPH